MGQTEENPFQTADYNVVQVSCQAVESKCIETIALINNINKLWLRGNRLHNLPYL